MSGSARVRHAAEFMRSMYPAFSRRATQVCVMSAALEKIALGAEDAQAVAFAALEQANPFGWNERRCKVPPPGWWCSREPGHEGPCAARSTQDGTLRITGGGEQPLGFVRPDTNCQGRWVFVNFYEGRNPDLPWEPIYRTSGVSPIAPARTEGGALGDKGGDRG